MFGRCESLKAYGDFQATAAAAAGRLPSSECHCTSTGASYSIPSSSSISGGSRAVDSAAGAGVRGGSAAAGGRVPSAAAAAARAAQQAGLELMGSNAASAVSRASS